MAQGVVVADFPKHSRIGAHRHRHADGPDKRQHGDTVQHISGHDDFPELARSGRDKKCVALTPHEYRAPQAFTFDVGGRFTRVPAGT